MGLLADAGAQLQATGESTEEVTLELTAVGQRLESLIAEIQGASESLSEAATLQASIGMDSMVNLIQSWVEKANELTQSIPTNQLNELIQELVSLKNQTDELVDVIYT